MEIFLFILCLALGEVLMLPEIKFIFPNPKGCDFDFLYSVCKISISVPLGAGVKDCWKFRYPNFILTVR